MHGYSMTVLLLGPMSGACICCVEMYPYCKIQSLAKEEMKKIWAKEKQPKPHKTWKEHNAWLDTFRAKIITGNGDKY